MSTLTETVHAGAFLISEAPGLRSREKRLVVSGQDLAAGAVVMLSGGKLTAWTGGTSAEVHGILLYPCDATGGDTMATFIARDAEVRTADLTYTAGTTTLVVNDLLLLGIVCR